MKFSEVTDGAVLRRLLGGRFACIHGPAMRPRMAVRVEGGSDCVILNLLLSIINENPSHFPFQSLIHRPWRRVPIAATLAQIGLFYV